MKVLHVLDSFSFGGAEQLVASLGGSPAPGVTMAAASLAPAGLGRDAMLPRLEAAGLAPTHFGVRRLVDPVGLARLVRRLRGSGADVVHAHLGYAATVVPVAARLAGLPCVATLHHVPQDLSGAERLKERWSVRVPARWGRLVLVSHAARHEFAVRHGPATPSWRVIHNGVDLTRFREGPGALPDPGRPPTWLAVAALRQPKGHLDLLEAWARLVCAHPGARLLIAGDGPERPAIESAVTRLGLTREVELLGSRDDVPALLRQVDGVVSASHTEALPTALIEASAAGLPVVATAVGGTVEVVLDGTTGLLVPPHRPDRLAEALDRLVDAPDRRVDFGRAGRLHAEGVFAMQPWIDQLLDLYHEVIDLRPRHRRATLTSSDPIASDVETPSVPRSGGRRSEPGARAGLARSVALAVLTAVLVAATGGVFVLTRPTTYEASLDVLVTPAAGASDSDAAALFDSLSKGQVAATAAEIYRQHRWLGGRTGTVEAGVVTPSAVVQVVARASSASAAQDLVQAVVSAADPTIDRELDPYRVGRLDADAPSVAPVGLSRGLELGLVLVAALVVGAGVLRLTHPRPKVTSA
jgi:glycosyltransferase involved in cell wall biosynthesis